mmetsp:Transcript_2076/g.4330  ORF Transcript_2076/g.4330 Transcript_2076/m.4330 type:complete len:227 (-) Transcript_2076:65-745(-)|eukprot:CAMPEP_0183359932 /NCGR_PEP_ID=MMETSP0164_2-20130417/53767_1 /TAXON_ID=221442 /ORGANISM="Coccolithus pelagicus ssp braarudi, Strain PLY182g" /LENGTH=226 /DNA_ID=CAMNT_0025534161 /DNA_START=75 /DNA_END=755 /DNA_ORIENTATION=+
MASPAYKGPDVYKFQLSLKIRSLVKTVEETWVFAHVKQVKATRTRVRAFKRPGKPSVRCSSCRRVLSLSEGVVALALTVDGGCIDYLICDKCASVDRDIDTIYQLVREYLEKTTLYIRAKKVQQDDVKEDVAVSISTPSAVRAASAHAKNTASTSSARERELHATISSSHYSAHTSTSTTRPAVRDTSSFWSTSVNDLTAEQRSRRSRISRVNYSYSEKNRKYEYA